MIELPLLPIKRKLKSIAVLTSGGDAPGMNAAIRAVVRFGISQHIQVYGVHKGYSGLLEGQIEPLYASSVANIIQRGGTILKTDRCEAFFEKSTRKEAAHILERKEKNGLGTAYIAGFRWCLKNNYDFIFEMDADFSHNPDDLIKLFQACEKGADMSIGSRYKTGVNVVNWPMSRVILSYYASAYVRIITGMSIRDTTAGFVCYRKELLESIDLEKIKFRGYAFQIEMKFTAWKQGFTLEEVPIIFTDRTLGESKISSGIIKEAIGGVLSMKIKSLFRKYPQKKA